MRSYRMNIGYNGQDRLVLWECLKSSALYFRAQPTKIIGELRSNAPEAFDETMAMEYAIDYANPESLSLRIIDAKAIGSVDRSMWDSMQPDDREPFLWMAASGGEPLKFAVRRAFCRLLIGDMHRQGIDVDLIVG